jgi:Protein of unknown function (DUF3102)
MSNIDQHVPSEPGQQSDATTDTVEQASGSLVPASMVWPETIPPFDSEALEPDIAHKLRQTAVRIRKCTGACVLEIGRELLQVKYVLHHGQWRPWLDSECELRERTAQRMMNVARWIVDKSVTVTDLPPSIL